MINYLKNSFKELSKVSWPTLQQTVRLTVFIIIFTIVLALAIGGLDYVFNAGYQAVVDYSIENGLGTEAGTTPIDPSDIDVQVDGSATGEGIQIVPEVETETPAAEGEAPATEETPTETEQPAN